MKPTIDSQRQARLNDCLRGINDSLEQEDFGVPKTARPMEALLKAAQVLLVDAGARDDRKASEAPAN